jgi:hypothetical protein
LVSGTKTAADLPRAASEPEVIVQEIAAEPSLSKLAQRLHVFFSRRNMK